MTQPARAHLVPIDQVADMLGSRIEALVHELLPHGQRRGHEWVALNTQRGERTPGAFAVHLTGSKAGVWRDFAANIGGDALDLVAYWRFAGDKRQALAWSRSWLGLDAQDPARLAAVQQEHQAASAAREKAAEDEREKTRGAAMRIWLAAQPGIAGTPVEHYLAGRGIDLAEIGRQPRALRFHPALWCVEADRHLPAMVASVSGGTGAFAAVHRTWLEQAGPNAWRKARLVRPKMVLGAYAGGSIRIWRGKSGKSLADAPPGEIVDLVEGIEDALSVAMACPEARVLACVSLSNMGSVVLPDTVKAVRLWRERDDSNAAILAGDRAVRAHLAAGRQVLEPAIPHPFKDVNDLLRGHR